MLDEKNAGFLSGDPGNNATGPGHNPVDAVRAVEAPRETVLAGEGIIGGNGYGDSAVAGDAAPANRPQADDGYGDFEWPEGYAVDPAALEKFVPLARKLGLAKEGAQELASLYAQLDQERRQAQAQFIAKNNEEWTRAIHSHPEFGGRNLERTASDVAGVMRRYGSPLLTAQIRQMNVQNWPEMFFFLARVSRAVNEDCSPAGFGSEPPAKSTAQLLFPGLK